MAHDSELVVATARAAARVNNGRRLRTWPGTCRGYLHRLDRLKGQVSDGIYGCLA
jgi:hypothetical protein